MNNGRYVTAEELRKRLEADPDWLAKRAARDARQAERARQIHADEASLIADLKAVGVSIGSVYDFVGKQAPPPAAFPVLVRHLAQPHHRNVREGVIRVLSYPGARAVALVPLCHEYGRERDPHLRWAIANALSGMARLEELGHLPGIQEFAALFA